MKVVTSFIAMCCIICTASALSITTNSVNDRSKTQLQPLPSHLQEKIDSSIKKGEHRARSREMVGRPLCHDCNRPVPLCICESLPPAKIQTMTSLLILQHPNEFRKRTLSTVPLMMLVLENITTKVGLCFDPEDLPSVQEHLARGQEPILLFPGPNAVSIDKISNRNNSPWIDKHQDLRTGHSSQSNLLILFDGTWSETNRMMCQSPRLVEVCQQMQFSMPANECLYNEIRREPHNHCLSTLEAAAQALNLLESAEEASRALKAALVAMIGSKIRSDKSWDNAVPRN